MAQKPENHQEGALWKSSPWYIPSSTYDNLRRSPACDLEKSTDPVLEYNWKFKGFIIINQFKGFIIVNQPDSSEYFLNNILLRIWLDTSQQVTQPNEIAAAKQLTSFFYCWQT